jgi:hypothetical protein
MTPAQPWPPLRQKREDIVVRQGRKWSAETSRLLPWCFWDQLSMNGWTPHGKPIAWATELQWAQVHRNGINVLEPLPINPSNWLEPYCCYLSTVVFYLPNTHIEAERCDCAPRMWPTISFAVRNGEFYEVVSGRVVHVFDKWQHEWRCRKNTELARHFNGHCPCGATHESCVYCQLLAPKVAA